MKKDSTNLNNKIQTTVVKVSRFIAFCEIVDDFSINSVVKFENNEIGMVWQETKDYIVVLLLSDSSQVVVGMKCSLSGTSLYVKPGDELLGRIVNPMLKSVDGAKLMQNGEPLPVFGAAPAFHERAIVDTQLDTGVLLVDMLFPIVKGQRISVIGDNKSGKTTFLSQVVTSQRKTDTVMVYVLIAKHRHDSNKLVEKLKKSDAMKNCVIVVADIFDSLPLAFLAPYVGCAIAEHFWRSGRDTIVFYDDLSAHAKLYREMSLLLNVPPGREGYPGDMFYRHSSLLERAGKLKRNKASQTVLAVGTTPTGDLTGYLPTNMISMTDGQIVFNLETMNEGLRPAIDIGVSVSRVGGRTQSEQFQKLALNIRERLARYRVAKDYSKFGGDISETVSKELVFWW